VGDGNMLPRGSHAGGFPGRCAKGTGPGISRASDQQETGRMACRSMPGNRNARVRPYGANDDVGDREGRRQGRHREARQIRNVPDHVTLTTLAAMHLADRRLLDGCLPAARIMQGRARLGHRGLGWIRRGRHRVNRQHELRPQQDHRRQNGEAKLQAVASKRFHSLLSLKVPRAASIWLRTCASTITESGHSGQSVVFDIICIVHRNRPPDNAPHGGASGV